MKNKALIYVLTTLVLIVAVFCGLIFFYQDLPQQTPFFYSLPWGEQQLAPKMFLFVIPLISLTIFIVNLVVRKFFTNEKDEDDSRVFGFITEALIFVSLICSFINLITVINILKLFI